MKYIFSYRFISFLLLVFCVSVMQKSVAQNIPSKDFVISAQGHYGYIISHRNNMAHLIKGHIYGGEVNYIFRTDGSKIWQQIHKYPEWGLCALHLYLANPSQLGNMEAIYPYANLRLNKLNRKFALNLRLGLGLAYLTKSFDRISNYKNNAIGSHLNGFVNLRLSTVIMLTKTWRLDAGVGLSHASNGAMKTPNLGLNVATVNLGIGYVFGNKEIQYKKDSIPSCEKKWSPGVIIVWGIKELEKPCGPKYNVFGLQLNMYRVLNHKNKLGTGIEMTYNTATKQLWANDLVYTNKFGDITQAGAKLAYAFTFHRISVPVDFGVYFYKKQKVNGLFFHRTGIRYMINEHFMANVTLLTHWAKADYFEWGIGYQF